MLNIKAFFFWSQGPPFQTDDFFSRNRAFSFSGLQDFLSRLPGFFSRHPELYFFLLFRAFFFWSPGFFLHTRAFFFLVSRASFFWSPSFFLHTRTFLFSGLQYFLSGLQASDYSRHQSFLFFWSRGLPFYGLQGFFSSPHSLQREIMSVYSPVFYSFCFGASFPDTLASFQTSRLSFFLSPGLHF